MHRWRSGYRPNCGTIDSDFREDLISEAQKLRIWPRKGIA